jgi:hypothetical protein
VNLLNYPTLQAQITIFLNEKYKFPLFPNWGTSPTHFPQFQHGAGFPKTPPSIEGAGETNQEMHRTARNPGRAEEWRCLHGVGVVDVGLQGLEGASQRELPPLVTPLRRHGTALQELDSLEPGQLPAPDANRRRRLPRFSPRVEREGSELSL